MHRGRRAIAPAERRERREVWGRPLRSSGTTKKAHASEPASFSDRPAPASTVSPRRVSAARRFRHHQRHLSQAPGGSLCEAPSRAGTWWFLTIVGALVAKGGTVAAVAAQRGDEGPEPIIGMWSEPPIGRPRRPSLGVDRPSGLRDGAFTRPTWTAIVTAWQSGEARDDERKTREQAMLVVLRRRQG